LEVIANIFWIFCGIYRYSSIDVNVKVKLGKPITAHCGKIWMYLLFAGNDTVPISMCRGGSMCALLIAV